MNIEAAHELIRTLRNPINKKILDMVTNNPGMNQTEVWIGIREKSQPDICQRLNRLIKIGAIKKRRYGITKRYYPLPDFQQTLNKIEEIK